MKSAVWSLGFSQTLLDDSDFVLVVECRMSCHKIRAELVMLVVSLIDHAGLNKIDCEMSKTRQ